MEPKISAGKACDQSMLEGMSWLKEKEYLKTVQNTI